MTKPIYLIGFMGSGKTTCGKKLASRLGYDFIDLDEMIENKHRITIPNIFSKYDENTFRLIEQNTLKQTFDLQKHVIATGGGTPCFFNNMDLMNASGLTIYIRMHPKSLHQRLKASKKKRPLIEQRPEGEVLTYIEEMLNRREVFYNQARIVVKGENLDINDILKKLQEKYKQTMTSSPLFKKLRVPENGDLLIINAPDNYSMLIRSSVKNQIIIQPEGKLYGFIHLFATQRKELEEQIKELLLNLQPDGIFWISYPKKSSKINTNISRNDSWDILKVFNYRPVTQISVDDTWSAIRIRPADKVKTKERKNIPEIDYDRRIVFPPPDFKEKLLEQNVFEMFDKLSFTHKKEHVEAILEAKKAETRERRILKCIEILKLNQKI